MTEDRTSSLQLAGPRSRTSPADAGPHARRVVRAGFAVATALLVANCASQQKYASKGSGGVDPKYGVAASPKVVADGDPVPKGGGRDLVGKPYVVAGRLYTPREMPNYSAVGLASWYGPSFHGRLTANGEVFDRGSVSAAHPTMPLPSYVRVTNLLNGHSIVARVNDRGPYHGGRLIDVSQRVAEALSFRNLGTAKVKVDYLGRASLAGSDDERLMATLRTDGVPASLRGAETQVASAAPVSQPAAAQPAVSSPRISTEAVSAAETQAADEAPEATPVAARPVAAKPAPGVPLPPDRPFDLGQALRQAPASAAAAKVPLPLPRTVMRGSITTASMFAAPDDAGIAGIFRRDDPMAGLTEQNFVPLRRQAASL
jgi:rare lipoprotein A